MPYATINGHSLYYTIIPPESSPPKATLFFVHGLGSTSSYYYPILPYLTDYNCVLFDNFGAGRSESSGKGTSVKGIAEDVLGLMQEVGVQRGVVVGYSMGGMIPTYLAANYPSKVIAGICIGPVHPTDAIAQVFRGRVKTVSEQGMEAMANTIPNAAPGAAATPLHRAFIREMLLAQTPEGYIANCKAIENATPPEYAEVKCPVLIVAGEEDKSASVAGCEVIYGGLGTEELDKELVVLSGVGHWFCVEAAEETGLLVKRWLGTLKL